jgi:hypothetical protein
VREVFDKTGVACISPLKKDVEEVYSLVRE